MEVAHNWTYKKYAGVVQPVYAEVNLDNIFNEGMKVWIVTGMYAKKCA